MEKKLLDNILEKMKNLHVKTRLDAGFDKLTTLGTGGKICAAVFPDTISQLTKVIRYCDKMGVSTVILGRGSNVLASDAYFDGVVIVTTGINKFRIKGCRAAAQCGASTSALARALAENGLSGGEFLACLPATVGGAVVGNAGCFDEEIKDILKQVTVLKNGKICRIKGKNCKFAKRDSIFKHNDWIVLEAKFKFKRSERDKVRRTIAQMRVQKAQTQPLDARSAGCVLFHDSVSVSRLIDEMGYKGYRVGGAEVSTKHAGFILNIDKAASLDIYLIIRDLQRALWERYGIIAKREVSLVNFAEDNNDVFSKCKE